MSAGIAELKSRHREAGSLDLRYNWCQKWDAEMSTRASAKQLELEEQLAKLVSTMELQQQCQEQQQQDQKQLAWEQQQRQEEIIRQEKEQFDCLLEEQQQQRRLLIKQQREAEEYMGALKDDLEQTKDAIEGRIQATKAPLEAMHRELTEQLQAGQVAAAPRVWSEGGAGGTMG